MYWNDSSGYLHKQYNTININMRCIEMIEVMVKLQVGYWLTLTWDVLKFSNNNIIRSSVGININMRCIEI